MNTVEFEMSKAERRDYWNKVYANSTNNSVPSQFAAFVANEIDEGTMIIDLGCGSGRDSFFFAAYDFEVLGVDSSASAVAFLQERVTEGQLPRIRFAQSDASGETLSEIITSVERPLCIYARFLLHAIDDQEEASLLKTLKAACKEGDLLAVEYRTVDDAETQKVAKPHFRRFLEPSELDLRIEQAGFAKIYGAEGRGFARHKTEDAMVARSLYLSGSPND